MDSLDTLDASFTEAFMRRTACLLMACVLLMLGCGGVEERVLAAPDEGSSAETSEAALDLGLVLVTCPVGTSQASYSPGLKNTPQNVTVSGQATFSNCVTVLGDPVTSGTSSLTSGVVQGFSCGDLLLPRTVTQTVTWNTGESSTMVFTQLRVGVQDTLSVFTLTGTVLSGKFVDSIAVRTITYVTLDLEDGCASPEGLTSLSGLTTLTLTKLL
ncbi:MULTISPECIES: hypothetical protein [Myxococcus]|uniref:Uncharacterized protein n=1 Tax=Myxococcus llanfairpwllgwyngyllgogerychwyrndrobwllllantysiliogogogochensis TaxID=2590453 RepID=A0A540X1J8_9BACT|nr:MULTISPECIES: hypothetical protein [Myxococcus]NTX02683.1 hypothetical protein [Myxococcus sp. CA040A]TQF15145.1 hypothetical protein FJV41_15140 [Myxococcus llanfairpwllgwyngyllgogerychwyrndrobwllllantysiliogogogochensis]